MEKSNFNHSHYRLALFLALATGIPYGAIPASAANMPDVIQQASTLKGHITDAQGEPIIGASVLIKGSKQGTVTDLDGNFSIANVPTKGAVVISYIGYKDQEVTYTSGQPLQIVLTCFIHRMVLS